jgi:hypothetical protein
MDTKEKHIRENNERLERKIHDEQYGAVDQNAESLKAQGRIRKENGVRRTNRLWIWLGVIILIFILIWWLFSIGTFSDIVGTANG